MSYFAKKELERVRKKAVVYCESNFGKLDGKTANGLVRFSEEFEILAVIDSQKAGEDSGNVLDGVSNGIPICKDLTHARSTTKKEFDCFIYGVAPASGKLSKNDRNAVIEAISLKMDVVNGLHEFFCEDAEFVVASKEMNTSLIDVRKPPHRSKLRTYTGRVSEIKCPRIAIMGTDCAIGKRTTATILTHALNERGIKTIMISTGQTGLMQGARYGVALDSIPSQFCAGELEAVILDAYDNETPDVIIIEGQGALGHPAYSTSSFILRGSCPSRFILQHAPNREHRCDFPNMAMPSAISEINIIQSFCKAKPIGLTINSENMSRNKIIETIDHYSQEFDFPVVDPINKTAKEKLIEIVTNEYPEFKGNQNVIHL